MAGTRWVLVAAMAVAVAACGSDPAPNATDADVEGDGSVRIETVAEATESAGTARFEGTSRFGSGEHAQSGSYSGAVDFVANRSLVESRTTNATGKERAVKEVSVDGYTYSDDPIWHDTEGRDPGKPWTRNRFFGASVGTIPLAALADLETLFAVLERNGLTREVLGTDTVQGAETAHVRFVSTSQPRFRQLDAMTPGGPDGDSSLELWVDAQDRLRRLRVAYDSSDESQSIVDIEFVDYGEPVKIEPPPDDQVEVDTTWDVIGDWQRVGEGTTGDIAWQAYRAPTADGHCLAIDLDAPDAIFPFMDEQRGHVPLQCATRRSHEQALEFSNALPLPNGMALLVGEVREDEPVTVYFDDGRNVQIETENRFFAISLEPDDLVRMLVPHVPGDDPRCELSEGAPEFWCDDETPVPPPLLPPPLEVPTGPPG